ncbi:ribokinase [Streptomyces sp. SID3343]|uniref:ribokinase n=1 Tax=Streptomyces sp. SID3343 TaxID=2690260 RepID=UPI0013680B5B|nr:ribokinase [Streptomyces sp. SID3343]MYW03159.1 ribokinase [Streptomyces sp. SID3343]
MLVVGSVNADLVVRVARHARPGETVLGGDLVVHPGGKGANQAVAAARLGAHVAMAGRVGSDAYGAMLVDTLRAEGVDAAHVREVAGASGVALITVDDAGENSITVAPGANARFGPQDVADLVPAIAAARVVSLQLEIPLDTVWEVVRRCREHRTRVVLNLSPSIPSLVLMSATVARECDPLVLNQHEASVTTGVDDARGAIESWRALGRGPRSIVLTLGGGGTLVAVGDGEPVHVAAPTVDVVDTTGAGDAFTGALAWRLAAGDDLVTATRYAVRVGAAAVRREGAQSSYPTADEVPLP